MITKAGKCYDYQILSNNSLGKSTEISLDKLYWGLRVDGVQLSLPSHRAIGHQSFNDHAVRWFIDRIIEASKREISKLGRNLLVEVHVFKVWDRELLDSESKRPYTVLETEKAR